MSSTSNNPIDGTHVDTAARTIWNYLQIRDPLEVCDLMVVLGSNDPRVASYAAELYLRGLAPHVIFSGCEGRGTVSLYGMPEAHYFARIALECGVPGSAILLEDRARNTGENIRFSRNLAEAHGLQPEKVLLVQKNFMGRRALVTFRKWWNGPRAVIACPPIDYDAYWSDSIPKEQFLNMMVGDLQRMWIYPRLGYQAPDDVPSEVVAAFETMVAFGYTKSLIE